MNSRRAVPSPQISIVSPPASAFASTAATVRALPLEVVVRSVEVAWEERPVVAIRPGEPLGEAVDAELRERVALVRRLELARAEVVLGDELAVARVDAGGREVEEARDAGGV